MSKHLVQYVRDKNNVPVACLVGIQKGDAIKIGWSKCHSSDRFDKSRARSIAVSRIHKGVGPTVQRPRVIDEHLPKFLNRCSRYFKNAKCDHFEPSYFLTS